MKSNQRAPPPEGSRPSQFANDSQMKPSSSLLRDHVENSVAFLFEKVSILLDVILPLRRHISFKEDSRHRANRLARCTIYTGRRVYIHLLLVRASLYAVNGAYINAGQFFSANARLANYKRQKSNSPSLYL